jgi:hypothetical protein
MSIIIPNLHDIYENVAIQTYDFDLFLSPLFFLFLPLISSIIHRGLQGVGFSFLFTIIPFFISITILRFGLVPLKTVVFFEETARRLRMGPYRKQTVLKYISYNSEGTLFQPLHKTYNASNAKAPLGFFKSSLEKRDSFVSFLLITYA